MEKRKFSIKKLRELKNNQVPNTGSSISAKMNNSSKQQSDSFEKSNRLFSNANEMNNVTPKAQTKSADSGNPKNYINDKHEKAQNEKVKLIRQADTLWRYKWFILLIPLFILPIIYFQNLRKPKIYKTSFDVLIKNISAELKVMSEKPIIKNQFDNKAWLKIANSSQIMKKINDKIRTPYSTGALQNMIKIKQETDVENIYNVEVTGLDPDQVVSIAKTYFGCLNEFDKEKLYETTNQVLDYLKDQLKIQNDKIADIDRKTVQYLKKYNVSGTKNLDNYYEQLDSYRQKLQDIDIELKSLSAHKEALSAELNENAPSFISETTYSEPLKAKLMTLQINLASSRTKYSEAHPKIKELQQNIAYVEDMLKKGSKDNLKMKSMSKNPVSNQMLEELMQIRAQEVAIRSKRDAYKKLISSIEYKLDQMTNKNDELADMKNRKKAVEKLIDELHNKLYESELNLKTISDRIVLLDQIKRPNSPQSNNFRKNMMLALIASLGLGIALAFGYDMLDDRIKSIHDYENFCTVPVIGTVRHLKNKPLRY